MLTVTETAARVINSLVTKHQMPEGAGLRITRQGRSTRSEGVELSIAAAPAEDESVVESNGARVFLPPYMVTALQDQELDVEPAEEDGQEQPHFIVDRRKRPAE